VDLFDSIKERLRILSTAARQIIISEFESRRVGIPGYAAWAGFDERGRALVSKNGQTIPVTLISNVCPPIGARVYVDETLSVDYKVVPRPIPKPVDPAKNTQAKARPKKNTKPILPVLNFEDEEEVFGATWLVYHESLRELDWTTVANGAANPGFGSFDPLSSLLVGTIGLFVIGSLLFSDMEFHFRSYSFEMSDIPAPEDHPEIPEGVEAGEFNYFAILGGLLENLNWRNVFPLQSTDGVFIGNAPVLSNTIVFLPTFAPPEGVSGFSFSPKYFLRPWDSYRWSTIQGFLTHFGPGKVQWSLTRAVGVYPPKKFNINIHAWRAPDGILPAEYNAETAGEFPDMLYTKFVIPDSIEEWSQLRGNSTKRDDNPELNQGEVIVYDVLPAHDFYGFEEEAKPDLTKFSSYSSNYLHLNYVIKAYAPWTGIDDSLRINYYSLSLRVEYKVEDVESPELVVEYKLNASTFNLPPELLAGAEAYTEDENFPLQAGSGEIAQEPITYTFVGLPDNPVVETDDPTTELINEAFFEPLELSVQRGQAAIKGQLIGYDVDIYEDLTWVVEFPPPGFAMNETNGLFVFEPNVQEYEVLGLGESFDLAFDYYLVDRFDLPSNSRTVIITITGNPDVAAQPNPEVPEGPRPEPSVEIQLGESDPVPSREWDPEPFEESRSTGGGVQSFETVETFIPLSKSGSSGGGILGWQGRQAKIIVEEVTATLRLDGAILEKGPFTIQDMGTFTYTEHVNDEGRIDGLLCTMEFNEFDIDWLQASSVLTLTYTVTARLNGAPYVGNFEDLSDNQLRKVRSDFIHYAFDTDWRSDIYNTREEVPLNPVSSKVLEDSLTRDTNFEHFNIDPVSRTVSADYIREFSMHNLAGIRDEDEGGPLNEQKVFLTNSLIYRFDSDAKELLFFWDGIIEVSAYSVKSQVLRFLTANKHANLTAGDYIDISGYVSNVNGYNGPTRIKIKSIEDYSINIDAPGLADTNAEDSGVSPVPGLVFISGYIRYSPDEEQPILAEDVADYVRITGGVTIGNKWNTVLMPSDYERNGLFASSFDYDPELSKRSKGYLIFGFLGD